MKSLLSLALSVVMALTGCGDSTTASTSGSTSGEPTITDGASQTSNVPTSSSDDSASETTSSSSNPTSEGSSGATSTDTDGFECGDACRPGEEVTRDQMVDDLNVDCDEIFPPDICMGLNIHLNLGLMFVGIAALVQSQIQNDGCSGVPPLPHPGLELRSEIVKAVGELQCIGFLKTEEVETLCFLAPLCQKAWAMMWKKKFPLM